MIKLKDTSGSDRKESSKSTDFLQEGESDIDMVPDQGGEKDSQQVDDIPVSITECSTLCSSATLSGPLKSVVPQPYKVRDKMNFPEGRFEFENDVENDQQQEAQKVFPQWSNELDEDPIEISNDNESRSSQEKEIESKTNSIEYSKDNSMESMSESESSSLQNLPLSGIKLASVDIRTSLGSKNIEENRKLKNLDYFNKLISHHKEDEVDNQVVTSSYSMGFLPQFDHMDESGKNAQGLVGLGVDLNEDFKSEREGKIKKRLSWYDQSFNSVGNRDKYNRLNSSHSLNMYEERVGKGGQDNKLVELGEDEVELLDQETPIQSKNHEIYNRHAAKNIQMRQRSAPNLMKPNKSQPAILENKKQTKIEEIETKNAKQYEEYFKDIYQSKESDEQFYSRILNEWVEQDRLSKSRSSWLSTVFWFPILLLLRVCHLSFKLVYMVVGIFPDYFVPLVTSGFDFQAANRYYNSSKGVRNIFDVSEIPLEQKKQAAIVFAFMMLVPLINVALLVALFLLLFPLTTFPMLLYIIYIFKLDKTPETGERVAFLRYSKMWRHFVNYFPIRLVKTYNLDPKEKYVFCYHPHGIISFGAFGNFGTDATGFSKHFPGISLRLLTLSMNFYIPWLRELILSMGLCSCSKRSCNKILQRGPGSAIMLVVGGADESLLSAPGTYRLNVNSRKGFVRVAIDNQAHLVPVLGFGENDAFTTQVYEKGSVVRTFQDGLKRKFGFATPVFWGRDIVKGDTFGLLPHRTPIIAVVGKPLKCPEVPEHLKGDKLRTTAEGRAIVNKFHEQYILALKALYDNFKDKWAINRSESMILMGRNSLQRRE